MKVFELLKRHIAPLIVPCCFVFFGSQQAQAQSPNGPLNFGNNFFVTGDYVVGGARGMNVDNINGYTTGTIKIPDANPGITGTKSVPAGAEVVAAVLYWQTVEKSTVIPGQTGSGQKGFFRPVFEEGPEHGYPITGVNVASSQNIGFGGCTVTSTLKVLRTYRANVLGALPRDPSGNISANGTYEVTLPSNGNDVSLPLTRGATLVIIYRVLSASVPLNSIVIYDGAYAPGSPSLTMAQTVQGFYDAATSPVSRLTYIVGNGKSHKYQTVSLNNAVLPSLYGSGQPAFPGFYGPHDDDETKGTWDNPTWTFPDPKGLHPVLEDAASEPTQVVSSTSNHGCVDWGAVIFSTTVKNSAGDGLLDTWKKASPPGYCDASINEGVCKVGDASWVDLPGAVLGQKDVFVQLDYMCSSPTGPDSCTTGDGINYSFDPRPSGAIDMVTSAFAAKKVHLHINPQGTNQPNVHAIPEPKCTDLNTTPPTLCAFPNQAGVVSWKAGFDFFKNQLVDADDPTNVNDCATSPPAAGEACIPRFQPGKRYSWHYTLHAHAVARTKWSLAGGTLKSAVQSGNTVTFTTSTPVGMLSNGGYDAQGNPIQDPTCLNGRVTIIGAATNPNLNGTYCITNATHPLDTSFTITSTGKAITASYTSFTDPNFAVAPGQVGTASGFSDVGGADSLITLGLWGNPALSTSNGQQKRVMAGTFMHELGHGLGLTHGGFYFDNLTSTNNNYTPTIEANCKANFQSVMNYQFQVDLLDAGLPDNVPDYSEQTLDSLNKGVTTTSPFPTLPPQYSSTTWFVSWPVTFDANGNPVGSPAKTHCNGSPILDGATYSGVTHPPSLLSWVADRAHQDINFDGNYSEILRGYDEWTNTATTTGINLPQIGATGSNSTAEGGGQQFGGGGQQFGGGGQQFGGGGQQFGGGGQQFGGGGQQFGGGGQQFGGGGVAELDVPTANSFTRPPRNLMASEGASPRTITLNWMAPTFGAIVKYKVYRSKNGGAFTLIASVTHVTPPATFPDTTYTDTVTCDTGGYRYFVTAVINVPSGDGTTEQESVPSNTVNTGSNLSGQGPLTGCYTLTGFSSPASATHGSIVPVTWTLLDDFNTTGAPVNNLAAITSLVAIGPGGTRTVLVSNGTPTTQSAAAFVVSGGQFTFNWDTDPDAFPAGSYFFEVHLDSTQTQTTTSALQLGIDVNDTDTPQVTTASLPDGFVGQAYNTAITQHGGTPSFTWNFTGSLPPGISQVLNSGTLSGTTCAAGLYTPTATVTDSKSNSGTRGLTLRINKANTTTSVASNANPSVFGQMVTFTVTVAPQYACMPMGTVTLYDGGIPIPTASNLPLSGGMAMFATSALSFGMHTITAMYSGDTNFVVSTSTAVIQIVQANTTTSVTSSANPSAFGQAVTFTATVAPVAPGVGTPTGNVTFFDGAAQIGSATLSGGMATFTTSALSVGVHTITATYGGDTNFVGSTSSAVIVTVVTPLFFGQATDPLGDALSYSFNLSDNTFPDANWSALKVFDSTPSSGATFTAMQVTTVGNPPAYRQVTMTFGLGTIIVGHMSTQRGYNPTTQGAIASIGYSYDALEFNPPFTNAAVNYALLLFQNGTYYVPNHTDTFSNIDTWSTISFNNLKASDFSRLYQATWLLPGTGTSPAHPDFSSSGAPITFGYYSANTNGNTLVTTTSGIANGRAIVTPISPDLVWGSVTTTSDGNVKLMVRYASGSFNSQTTEAQFSLDTDQSTLTGSPGSNAGCSDDSGILGTDYLVVLQSGFGGNLAQIYKATGGCNPFIALGTAPVTVFADGMDVTFPLTLLTNTASTTTSGPATSGPWNFKVTTDFSIGGNSFSGLIDTMPNVGLPAASTASAPLPVPPPSGMVGWWPADGYPTDIQNNHSTALSGVAFVPSEVGQAFSVSGGSYVDVADAPDLNPTTAITVDVWVKANSFGTTSAIVKKAGVSGTQANGYAMEMAGGSQFAFWVYVNGGWQNAMTNTTFQTNTWYHIAGTYDGTQISLYVNGALAGSSSVTGTIVPSTNDLNFGRDPANPTDTNRFWDGQIDEIEIFNRALSAAEILAIFNAGTAGKAKP